MHSRSALRADTDPYPVAQVRERTRLATDAQTARVYSKIKNLRPAGLELYGLIIHLSGSPVKPTGAVIPDGQRPDCAPARVRGVKEGGFFVC